MFLTKTFQRFTTVASLLHTRPTPHFVPTPQQPSSTATPLPLSEKRNVLVLGAGLVSRPLIKYFERDRLLNTKILTNDLKNIKEFNNNNNIQTYDVDCADRNVIKEFIDESDLVISLLPRKMHFDVANVCLESRKSLVTPSYASPEILSLDNQARDTGILILNELGLAPGIDHLLSKRILDEVDNNRGKVIGYNSWTTGLPSPKSVDNPMGYKFTWDPEGVLMNIWNPIKFVENAKVLSSDGGEIEKFLRPITILDGFELEGLSQSRFCQIYWTLQYTTCEKCSSRNFTL